MCSVERTAPTQARTEIGFLANIPTGRPKPLPGLALRMAGRNLPAPYVSGSRQGKEVAQVQGRIRS